MEDHDKHPEEEEKAQEGASADDDASAGGANAFAPFFATTTPPRAGRAAKNARKAAAALVSPDATGVGASPSSTPSAKKPRTLPPQYAGRSAFQHVRVLTIPSHRSPESYDGSGDEEYECEDGEDTNHAADDGVSAEQQQRTPPRGFVLRPVGPHEMERLHQQQLQQRQQKSPTTENPNKENDEQNQLQQQLPHPDETEKEQVSGEEEKEEQQQEPPQLEEEKQQEPPPEQQPEQPKITGDSMMGFSRYADKTVREVFLHRHGFVEWAKKVENPSPPLKSFVDWTNSDEARRIELDAKGNEIMPIGQHKGESFRQIAACDPTYHIRYIHARPRRLPPPVQRYIDWFNA